MARRIVGLALLLAALAVLFVIVSPALAEHLVFYPDPTDPGAAPVLAGTTGRDVTLDTEDGVELHGWWYDLGRDAPGLALFHGNAGNIAGRTPFAEGLLRRGISVLLLDYRGYGRSRGRPSEGGIYRDGKAALAFLRERVGRSGRTALMGRSLGGAVAIRVASEHDVGALVVESSFTSLDEMAEAVYPFLPSFLFSRLRSRFDNVSRIATVRAPVLVVHGEDDQLVPPEMGRRLYAAAPEPKAWYAVPGAGHNDTFAVGGSAYFDRVADFVLRATDRDGESP